MHKMGKTREDIDAAYAMVNPDEESEPKAGDWEKKIDEALSRQKAHIKAHYWNDSLMRQACITEINTLASHIRALSSAAPRITEEMVEKIYEEVWNDYINSRIPFFNVPHNFKKLILALLRQQGAERSEHPQGPQRSEDQQGAEREWISVEERLPEYHKLVQVHGGLAWLDDDGEWYSATSAPNFMLADCIALGSIRIRWEVTHWMPYTPPPFTPTQTEE